MLGSNKQIRRRVNVLGISFREIVDNRQLKTAKSTLSVVNSHGAVVERVRELTEHSTVQLF
jgi:hypothetical protein